MREIIDIILMIIIYFLVFYRKWRITRKDLIVNTMLYIYICAVLILTILPIPWENGIALRESPGYGYGNLYPFHDYRLGYSGAVREIFLNMIMLMPLGFLYPIVKGGKFLSTVLASFIFSLSIELLQLLTTVFLANIRSFDTTDLITNTIGGTIGYLIYFIFRPLIQKILRIL